MGILLPADVGTVVMTDLHADHASAIFEFGDATFVVDRNEWEAASSGGDREAYVHRQFDHAFDYRLVDFQGPEADSFSSFGRSLDLFGDGRCGWCPPPAIPTGTCRWCCG